MHNNMQKLPDGLLEWIAERSFSELMEREQEVVLKHLSVAEYDKMHFAMNDLSSVAGNLSFQENPVRKEALMAYYDRRHGQSRRVPLSDRGYWSLRVWQAAAVLLLSISIWLGYDRKRETVAPDSIAVRDTIVRIKEVVVTNVIHDTVRLIASVTEPVSVQKMHKAVTPAVKGQRTASLANGFSDINVLPPTQLNALRNRSRGISMKDDTLLNQYAFVTL